MTDVVASTEAYTKALLHCYKYPCQPLLGLLVGKRTGANNTQPYVSDVYPLFHAVQMCVPHPMLEVAYAHCQSSAKTNGLSLLGVYIANELRSDRNLSVHLMLPLLDFFAARLGGGMMLVWFVDNDSLTTPPTRLSITTLEYIHSKEVKSNTTTTNNSAGKVPSPIPRPDEASTSAQLSFGEWNSDTLSAEASTPLESALESVNNALEAFAQFKLVDFEDHLEDPRRDYIRQPLGALMSRK